MEGVFSLVLLLASVNIVASTGEPFLSVEVLSLILCPLFPSGFQYVTCGSAIKLANSENNVRLHSHDVKYGSGSGQQVCWTLYCI